MGHPRVSIGLPVYNGEKHIAATIESLLAQTFTDFELIISDNASTDATEEICRAFAEQDSRIRYYREAVNHGAPWNLNRTFQVSKGTYFKWQAADDLCAPAFLQRCVEVLDRDPSVMLCYPRTWVIDSKGNVLEDAPGSWQPSDESNDAGREKIQAFESTHAHDRVREILLHLVWGYEIFGLIRSDAMRRTKLHGKRSSRGKAFLIEIALQGRFREIPEVLFYNRRHAGQYTMLTSAAAQQRFDNPRKKPRTLPVPHQVPCTIDYVSCILRSSLPWSERLRCLGVLMRYVFQVSKWKRIAVNTARGFGMWDGSLKPPEMEKPASTRPQGRQLQRS